MGQRKNQKRNKIPWEKWNGNTTYQNLWDATKSALKRKIHRDTCLLHGKKIILTLHIEGLEKKN